MKNRTGSNCFFLFVEMLPIIFFLDLVVYNFTIFMEKMDFFSNLMSSLRFRVVCEENLQFRLSYDDDDFP